MLLPCWSVGWRWKSSVNVSCSLGITDVFVVWLLLCCSSTVFAAEESICYGAADNGRLQHGWQLPSAGKNFKAYSEVGVLAGRNYVHSRIYRTIVDAYAILEKQAPAKTFVYGETGFRDGGKFSPHKTHRNGLSVDFFVPVIGGAGLSQPLPSGIFNRLGYGIEFDGAGRYRDLSIDFPAMALHLSALKQAADWNGVKIRRVIFDNALQKQLFKVNEAANLLKDVAFSTKKPWIRHDEHYHVDFIVSCMPDR